MKFQIYKDKAGEFRWRLISTRTKKIVADSGEAYKKKSALLRSIKSIQGKAVEAKLEDLTVEN